MVADAGVAVVMGALQLEDVVDPIGLLQAALGLRTLRPCGRGGYRTTSTPSFSNSPVSQFRGMLVAVGGGLIRL